MQSGVCTLCLSINRRNIIINNTYLQPLFEKLSDLKIDNVECWMCFICHRRLQQCHQLWQLAEHAPSVTRSIPDVQQDKKEVLFRSKKCLLELSTSKEIDICIVATGAREEFQVRSQQVKCEPLNEGAEARGGGTDVTDGTARTARDVKVEPELEDVQRECEALKEEYEVENITADRSDGETKAGSNSAAEDDCIEPAEGIEPNPSLMSSIETVRTSKALILEVNELKANICKYISNKWAADGGVPGHDPTADTQCGAAGVSRALSAPDTGCEACRCNISQCKCSKPSHVEVQVDTDADNRFTCSVCNVHFKSERSLVAHAGRVHAGDKRFRCEVCGRRFTRRRGLRAHASAYHAGAGPFVCDTCERPFSLKRNLVSHLRLHTNDRPYDCHICHKKFTLKKNLHNHLRIHKEQKLSCGICARKFKQKNSLQDHLRMHTGEKPFSCDICQRKFTRKNVLQRHLRVHTGKKPYHCDVCDLKFFQKRHLRVHFKSHTDEKPLSCCFCLRTFLYNHSLQMHLKIHTDETPFSCDICECKFSRKRSLNSHLRSHDITLDG